MDDGKKYDQGKPRLGLIPPAAELEMARVLTFGAEKYGPDNWRRVENAPERYMDALLRHVNAARSGEATDPESGMSHMAHVMCCAAFLLELGQGPRVESNPWIKWSGGECPVRGQLIQVRLRAGAEHQAVGGKMPGSAYNWAHSGAPDDIIAYRLL